MYAYLSENRLILARSQLNRSEIRWREAPFAPNGQTIGKRSSSGKWQTRRIGLSWQKLGGSERRRGRV